MECLDLKICEFKVEKAYLPNSYQCGWAWPVISTNFKVKLYIKYKIYRWTYHDRMHIKVRASKTEPNYSYIGEDDFCIIEDQNPSDNAIVKEKIIEKTLSYYDFGGSFKGEDYRKSGWREWHISFFTDSNGPTKAITLHGYWDANSCKFTQFKVDGVEQCPTPQKPSPEKPCTCDIIRQIFTSPDEVVEYRHAEKAYELAGIECAQYLFHYVGTNTRIGDLFPECFETALPEPKITLTADKTEIYSGDSVNFTANIEYQPNTCVKVCLYATDTKTGYTATECNTVSLDSVGHGTITFSVQLIGGGEYRVKACIVDMVSGNAIKCSDEITVNVKEKPAPNFRIDFIKADKTTLQVGETVNVTVMVRNMGNAGGTATVRLTVDGVEVARKSVYIDAGMFKSVTFSNVNVGGIGEHIICAKV